MTEVPEWDEFVRSHPLGLIFHRSEWARVIQGAFPHISPKLLCLRNESGRIKAGMPLYFVRSPILGCRIVSVPFAPICDPLCASALEAQALVDAAERWRVESCARSLELRTFRNAEVLARCNLVGLGSYFQHSLKLVRGVSETFASFSRTAVRRMVAKSAKGGINVRLVQSQEEYKSCIALFEESRRRLSLPYLPQKLYWTVRSELNPDVAPAWLALRNGSPVGAVLGIRFNRVFALEFSGENPDSVGSGANQALYWEAIRHAILARDELFHFGRTSSANTGLLAYKRHWGTAEQSLPIYYLPAPKIRANEGSKPYSFARAVLSACPKPLYRFFSSALYKHLG